MKKEFIPYNLALQLKELGFDKPCLAIYEHENKKLAPNLGLIPEWFNETNDNNRFEWKISAPLWQQAFDWFRIKYDIYIEIFHSPIWEYGWKFKYYTLGERLRNNGISEGAYESYEGAYETYEEAKQACLEKLIELCKKN